MSKETIYREDAIKALRKLGHEVVVIDKVCSLGVAQEFIDVIRELPSADRPQGEWVATDDTDEWYGLVHKCNICGSEAIGSRDNYCYNCGAKMKVVNDESD